MIPGLHKKLPIPKTVPKELQLKIKQYSKNKNKEEFLKKCFDYVTKNFGGHRINLFLKFSRLYQNDINKIIKTKGYMHCTTMNYLIRIMAIKSKLFTEKDIKIKLTNTWFIATHQYLEIKLSKNKKITLDPWNYQFGINYGDIGKGFDSFKLKPIR